MRKQNNIAKRRKNRLGSSSHKPSMDYGGRSHRYGRIYFTGGYRA